MHQTVFFLLNESLNIYIKLVNYKGVFITQYSPYFLLLSFNAINKKIVENITRIDNISTTGL